MAFNSAPPRVEYIANSGQTIFTFLFKIYRDQDLVIYLTPNGQLPDDTADELSLGVDYTVLINGDNGGSITLLNSTTSGDQLTLLRDLAKTRDVEYQTNGDLLAETLNDDQDYQTYLIADNEANNERYIRLPQNAQSVNPTLPAPESDSYLRWDTNGTQLINDTTIPTSVIDSQKASWKSEAARLTSESYATLFVDGNGGANEYVIIYTSNGDGTFSEAPQTNVFSSKWYEYHASTSNNLDNLTDVTITTPLAGDALVYNDATSEWVNGKVLGMPTETAKNSMTVTNDGVEGDSYWTPIVNSPRNVATDVTLSTTAHGTMVSPTIADNVIITIPDNGILVIL